MPTKRCENTKNKRIVQLKIIKMVFVLLCGFYIIKTKKNSLKEPELSEEQWSNTAFSHSKISNNKKKMTHLF